MQTEERNTLQSQAALQYLQAASSVTSNAEKYRSNHTRCQVDAALGQALLAAGDTDGARHALVRAAAHYRRDGWQGPLWQVLLLLRECAGREADVQAHIVTSLEAATLAGGGDIGQRKAMADAAVGELLVYGTPKARYECDSLHSPWASIIQLAAGFVTLHDDGDCDGARDVPKFGVALRSRVPEGVSLPLHTVTVGFDTSDGHFTAECPDVATHNSQQSLVDLHQNIWHVLYVSCPAPSLTFGMLCATEVSFRLGPSTAVSYVLPHSLAAINTPMDTVVGESERITWGQMAMEIPPRHAAPAVHFCHPGVAFAGECVPIAVDVVAGADSISDCILVIEALLMNSASSGPISPRLSLGSTRSSGGGVRVGTADGLGQQVIVLETPGGPIIDPGKGVSLPEMPSESSKRAVVYVPIAYSAGSSSIRLHARLSYRRAGGIDQGPGGPANVSAMSSLTVAVPFEIDVSVDGSSGSSLMFPKDVLDTLKGLTINPKTLHEDNAAPELQRVVGPRLPSQFLIPAQQMCIVDVSIRINTEAALRVTDVQLYDGGSAAAALVPDLGPIELTGQGSTCSFPFQIAPLEPGSIPTLGTLKVNWQRETSVESIPGELDVSLPCAVVVVPQLTLAVRHPPQGAMGQAMQLHLDFKSGTEIAKEMQIIVGDSSGFLISGLRAGTVALGPAGSTTLSLAAVPYHAGFLKLPEIKVVDTTSGEGLEAGKGAVFINPVALG